MKSLRCCSKFPSFREILFEATANELFAFIDEKSARRELRKYISKIFKGARDFQIYSISFLFRGVRWVFAKKRLSCIMNFQFALRKRSRPCGAVSNYFLSPRRWKAIFMRWIQVSDPVKEAKSFQTFRLYLVVESNLWSQLSRAKHKTIISPDINQVRSKQAALELSNGTKNKINILPDSGDESRPKTILG